MLASDWRQFDPDTGARRRWTHLLGTAPAVDADDAAWWGEAFAQMPPSYIRALNGLYHHIGTHVSRFAANQAMDRAREAIARVRSHNLPFDVDDDEICDAAALYVRRCAEPAARQVRRRWQTVGNAVLADPPPPETYETDILRAAGLPETNPGRPRLLDEHWWRRQLRRAIGRDIDQVGRVVGVVYRTAQCYCADVTVQRRAQQQQRIARTLRTLELVTGPRGDRSQQTRLPLDEVVARSVANPRVRRTELMTRIGGIEDWAVAQGWDALFITVTAPAAYHARTPEGRPYDWNGTTPREVQDYLMRVWARTRAAWKRAGLTPVGLRVVEPHHDGTPHWHALVFVPRPQAAALEALARAYALADHPDEPGAAEHRFKVVRIDRRRGRAAGYVAKYVAKAVDGFGVDVDRHGNPGDRAAARIRAWSSTWSIRQFQFFGAPPVGVWRELRRAAGAPAGPLGDAWRAADLGLWAEYMRVMAVTPVSLARAWSDKTNKYGEPVGNIIVGVEWAGVRLPTRREWRIEKRRGGDLGDLTITVRPNIVGLDNPADTTYSDRAEIDLPRPGAWRTPGTRHPWSQGPPARQ